MAEEIPNLEVAKGGQKTETIEPPPANKVAENTDRQTFSLLEKVPHWFVPSAGIIYATGFLIINTFFDRFGIRESNGDFFKVKYIHAGIVFWLLPVIIVIPFYGFYVIDRFGKEKENKDQEKEDQQPSFKVYVPSALIAINLLLVFYIVAVFAPQGFFANKEYAVPIMFLVTFLGIIIIQIITTKLIKDEISDAFGKYARWFLCLIVVIGLDVYTLHGLWTFLWGILWNGGIYFFVFIFVSLFIIERTRVRTRDISDWRQRLAVKVIAACLMIATFYLSVLAFALRIYPFIPVTKGGGDYVGTPNVVLCFQETNGKFILPDISAVVPSPNECIKSKELQIIEESGSSIFVADPKSAGGPTSWRIGKKPVVYEVRREKIGSITYLNPQTPP